MADDSVWIDDEPPSSTPPAPQFELPRLQIIHLMMWMAATAVALVPYRVQQDSFNGSDSSRAVGVQLAGAMAMAIASGVAQGAYLFVTTAVIVWRRRGYAGRLEPGHYFAFHDTAQWVLSFALWASIWITSAVWADDASMGRWYAIFALPQFIVGIVFFVWFLRLASRGPYPRPWRRALRVFAIVPVAGWMLSVVLMMTSFRSGLESMVARMLLPQFLCSGVEFVTLAAAMQSDRRDGLARHWSHWVSVMTTLLLTAGLCLFYLAIWIMPLRALGK